MVDMTCPGIDGAILDWNNAVNNGWDIAYDRPSPTCTVGYVTKQFLIDDDPNPVTMNVLVCMKNPMCNCDGNIADNLQIYGAWGMQNAMPIYCKDMPSSLIDQVKNEVINYNCETYIDQYTCEYNGCYWWSDSCHPNPNPNPGGKFIPVALILGLVGSLLLIK